MRGGRNLFPLLPEAFKGIKQIGVIGWGSQVLTFIFSVAICLLLIFSFMGSLSSHGMNCDYFLEVCTHLTPFHDVCTE